MSNPLTDLLPPEVRKPVYAAYAFLGLGLGSTQVAYSAAETGQPQWLIVALAVYTFVGAAFGFTAASNVPSLSDVASGEVSNAEVVDALNERKDDTLLRG